MGSQSRVGKPEVRAQTAMKVQRAGRHRGSGARLQESSGPLQTGRGLSVWKRQLLGPRTPAAPPAPLPSGPCAPALWAVSAQSRRFPLLPRRFPLLLAYPFSLTGEDLSWPPPAPPLPSRSLHRILRLLPKLFPLIPSSAAAAASHAARPAPPRQRDVTAQNGFTPPQLPAPFRPCRGQSPRLLGTPLILPLRPPHAALGPPAAPSGAGSRRGS